MDIPKKYNISYEKVSGLLKRAKKKIYNDKELRYLYNNYSTVKTFNTSSVITMNGSKSNTYKSYTESGAIRRIEIEEEIKKRTKTIMNINKRIEERQKLFSELYLNQI